MSIFHMLQEDRGRRASGNITFMEFEQLFDREQIRTFFQAGGPEVCWDHGSCPCPEQVPRNKDR